MKRASLKLLVVAGARPNFMKVAPIIKHILRHNANSDAGCSVEYRLIHTGQHYDKLMSDIFFDNLTIPAPDFNLGVGSGSHTAQTARIMSEFEPLCEKERPDWVIVVGDVNSTMACALVCAKLRIKVAHVEAGLRSFDRSMPEEVNRIVTDALADLLLTPSADADDNLAREGVPARKIKFVGNVMIDSLLANLECARASNILSELGLTSGRFIYATLHRPGNVDDRDSLEAVLRQISTVAQDIPVVLPLHPRTRKMCETFGITLDGPRSMHVVEPVGYHDSLRLTEAAALVLTDSGGLQEESTFFRTPCLTLRPNTERPITITMGSNRLTSIDSLAADIASGLRSEARIGQIPPLWDGRAAERIVDSILTAG